MAHGDATHDVRVNAVRVTPVGSLGTISPTSGPWLSDATAADLWLGAAVAPDADRSSGPRTARALAGALVEPPTAPGHRPAAGRLVRSGEHLSRILNSTDPKLIGGYGRLAHGTRLAASLPDAFEDDLLKLRAFGKAPPTRHLRNDVSRQLREQHEPGSCFFLDLGPVHPIDFQGHRFSRLGVDWATGFVHVFAETAGSSSLCSQLDELTSLARQRAGRTPCMFRMDFGSEAAVQGRGDDCITEGLARHTWTPTLVSASCPTALGLRAGTWQRTPGSECTACPT